MLTVNSSSNLNSMTSTGTPMTPNTSSMRRAKSISVEMDELLGIDSSANGGVASGSGNQPVPNANDVSLAQLSHYALTLANLHQTVMYPNHANQQGSSLLSKLLNDESKKLPKSNIEQQQQQQQQQEYNIASNNIFDQFLKEKTSQQQVSSGTSANVNNGSVWNRFSKIFSSTTPLLIERLNDNVKILNQAYDIISEAIMTNRRITSTDEWLVDNFWMINEQIHMAKKHLPPGFAKEMPTLTNTESAGMPRIYGLVLELISLVNGQISQDNVYQFVKAYQTVSPLNIGELWGIPIMLRLGLLENIKRVADEVINRRKDCNLADAWADKLLVAADKSSKDVVQTLFQLSQSDPKISNSFVLQISQRLQGSDPTLSVINTWLEQQLSTKGLDVDNICRTQRHSNSVDQITIRNSIQSLRFVNVFSWMDFVENLSLTESILRRDPSGIYVLQDFDSRDMCRHAVERIAQRNLINEKDVAQSALRCAIRAQKEYDERLKNVTSSSSSSSSTNNSKESFELQILKKQCHIGYWLLDERGSLMLHETEDYLLPLSVRLGRLMGHKRHFTNVPVTGFFASVLALSILFVLTVFILMIRSSSSGGTRLFSTSADSWIFTRILFSPLLFIPALFLVGTQLAVSLTNIVIVNFVGPKPMPKMDYHKTGVSDEHRG